MTWLKRLQIGKGAVGTIVVCAEPTEVVSITVSSDPKILAYALDWNDYKVHSSETLRPKDEHRIRGQVDLQAIRPPFLIVIVLVGAEQRPGKAAVRVKVEEKSALSAPGPRV